MKLYVAELTVFSGETRPYGVFIKEDDSNLWLEKYAFGYEEDDIPDRNNIILCEDYFTWGYNIEGNAKVGDIAYVHCSNGVDSADINGVFLTENELRYGYYKKFIIK